MAKVLTGAMNNGAYPGMQPEAGMYQTAAQTAPQQQNPEDLLRSFGAHYANQRNVYQQQLKGGGNRSGLYNFGNDKENFAALFPSKGNEDATEQYKIMTAVTAYKLVGQIIMAVQRRSSSGEYYKYLMHAAEAFKHIHCLPTHPQEPLLIQYSNEILNNANLVNQIVIDAGGYLAGALTYRAVVESREFMNDYKYVLEQFAMAVRISIFFNFMEWMKENPKGPELYYATTEGFRRYAEETCSKFIDVKNVYEYVNGVCPFTAGTLDKVRNKTNYVSPIVDLINTPTIQLGDMTYSAGAFDTNPYAGEQPKSNNRLSTDSPVYQYLYGKGQATFVHNEPQPQQTRISPLYQDSDVPLTIDDARKPKPLLCHITRENRLEYSFNDYFTRIGDTEWYLCDEMEFNRIGRTLDHVDQTLTNPLIQSRAWQAITVYKIDWQAGLWDHKIIPVGGEMEKYLSDPKKLLPRLFVENEQLKSTMADKEETTTDRIKDKAIIPVEKPRELTEAPKIIFGNKPYRPRDTADAKQTLVASSKSFDPKGALDAFVLPTVINTPFVFDNEEEVRRIHVNFPMLVKGGRRNFNCNTFSVIGKIGRVIEERNYADTEFGNFVTGYVTSLFNRYLVEVRGYSETKDGGGFYWRSSNIFKDIEAFLNLVKVYDTATLNALSDYPTWEFIDHLEFILDPIDTKEYFEELYAKEDDEIIRIAKLRESRSSVVFSRETVMIDLKNAGYPSTTDSIIVQESANPVILNVINRSLKQTEGMFDSVPQIVFHFNSDPNDVYWVATRSGFDSRVYTLRQLSDKLEYSTALV